MPEHKKEHPAEKVRLHPRNLHRERYDFDLLTESFPPLKPFVQVNRFQDQSIDFANPEAVKMLNKALLKQYYNIAEWDIPSGYLCPPIPGRADYVHYLADLLATSNGGKIPKGKKVTCLDVGVGANCIYPMIGQVSYGWSFIGSDIDPVALESANHIVNANPVLKSAIVCRLQSDPKHIFQGILQPGEYIDAVICNPPFHESAEAAAAATLRKLNNLGKQKATQPARNFGGQAGELWYEGGEKAFVNNMIEESRQFATSCLWFTTLISKASNVKSIEYALKNAGATEIRTIEMGQGQKTSRMVAWSFLNKTQHAAWSKLRWK